MKKVRRLKGMLLGSVLMVITLAIVVSFTLASTSVFHIRTAAHTADSNLAQNIAETAIGAALGQFANTTGTSPLTWGQTAPYPTLYVTRPFATSTCVVSFNPPPANPPPFASAVLTFDQPAGGGTSNAQNMQQSLNRYAPSGTAPPAGIPSTWNNPVTSATGFIPDGYVLLSAKGTAGGVSRHCYTLIHFPQFPYAIASSGKVTATGALLVASAASGQSAQAANAAAPTGQGNLASGSTLSGGGSNNAVVLSNQAHVTGNVEASGAVSLNGAVVDGNIMPNSSNPGLPVVDFNALDPTVMNLPTNTVAGGAATSPTMTGFNKVTGAYNVTGDLTLNNSVLYIDGGDLNVSGAIKGHGVVIVKGGGATVGQGSDVTATETAALVATGDVNLGTGGGTNQTQQFSGLVYTQGNFSAKNITLMGAFMGASTAPGGTQMSLQSVNAYQVPGNSNMTLNNVQTSVQPSNTISNNPSLNQGTGFSIGNAMYSVHIVKFVDPSSGTAYYQSNIGSPAATSDIAQFWQLMGQFLANDPSSGLGQSQRNQILADPNNWQNSYNLYNSSGAVTHAGAYLPGPLGPGYGAPWVANGGWPPPNGTISTSGGGTTTTGGGTTTTGGNGTYPFDMNQFISPGDRTRVVYWTND